MSYEEHMTSFTMWSVWVTNFTCHYQKTDWLSYPTLLIYNRFITRDLVCDFVFTFVFKKLSFCIDLRTAAFLLLLLLFVYTDLLLITPVSIQAIFTEIQVFFFGELKMFLWLFCVCACVLGLNPTHFPASVCRYVTSLTCDMTLDDQPCETREEQKKRKKWGCHCLIVNNVIISAPVGHLSPRPFSLTH